VLSFILLVIRLSSIAIRSPRIVTPRAANLRWIGMVTWGYEVGGMQLEIRNPAKMLPTAKRLIGFISEGLFSLIRIRDVNRGYPVRV